MKLTLKQASFHINPIFRDLLLVTTAGALVAVAIVMVGFMIFH
jgi:hypothetical protein